MALWPMYLNFRDLHLYQRVSPLWRDTCHHILSERLRPIDQKDHDSYFQVGCVADHDPNFVGELLQSNLWIYSLQNAVALH